LNDALPREPLPTNTLRPGQLLILSLPPSMPTDEDAFSCNSAVASPIEAGDDVSTSELNITFLSLPESFDDTICFDNAQQVQSNKVTSQPNASRSSTKSSPTTPRDEQETSASHYNALELKIRHLMTTNLELKEKGRMYDSLKARSLESEAEIKGLRAKIEEQSTLRDSVNVREKEHHHEILEYKRKTQLLTMDLEHSRKETEVLLNRAEKAEREYEVSTSSLKVVQQKYESTLSRIVTEREELKSQSDREVSRIREESNKEVMMTRTHQKEAFVREAKLLCDARDHAMEQSKALQQELNELRTERQTKDAEYSNIVNELERQLSDARSDLKVKSCELNTLQACNDRVISESIQHATEAQQVKQSLSDLQREFATFERQATIEKSKLDEMVRQKDEALEIYHHDDLLVVADDENTHPNNTSNNSKRKSLLQNSIALARKCRELQSLLQKTNTSLSKEREKNALLTKKEECNSKMFQELTAQSSKNASAYIISAVNSRDTEILELGRKIKMLEKELAVVRDEKNMITGKLEKVLERRDKLDEMKALVESMRSARVMNVMGDGCDDDVESGAGDGTTAMPRDVPIASSSDQDDFGDDLFEHMVHHKRMSM
jgi:hypothetical protein